MARRYGKDSYLPGGATEGGGNPNEENGRIDFSRINGMKRKFKAGTFAESIYKEMGVNGSVWESKQTVVNELKAQQVEQIAEQLEQAQRNQSEADSDGWIRKLFKRS